MAKKEEGKTTAKTKVQAENERLKAEIEKLKAEKAERVEKKRVDAAKDIKAKLDAEPHTWVQVFQKSLDDGVDFSFTYEGLLFRLISGGPVKLAKSVIAHLKGCHYPQPKYNQGEAGQAVKVAGSYHRYTVQNCEAPKEKAKVAI